MLPEERMRTRKRSSKVNTKDRLPTVKTTPERTVNSSQPSLETIDLDLPFDANSWLEVKEKLESIAWIQCDNQHCRKWRKISREELANLPESDKWFCHQNSDAGFRACDVPEEDVELYDQLARRSGLKYLKSQLTPGALVWAKMPGYCSWPAVVTSEPNTGAGHLWRGEEEEREITHYHVEFLGEPHSHGWVCAKDVKAFTDQSVDSQPAAGGHQTRGPHGTRRGRRGRSKPLCMPTQPRLKTTYRGGVSVERGVAEAIKLLPISPSKRLTSCTYVSGVELPKRSERDGDTTAVIINSASFSKMTNAGRKTTPVRSDISTPATTFTTFASSLDNRTKEERLMLDIEAYKALAKMSTETAMYKRNERAFEHDVTRFMLRNGFKMSSGPLWQNQRVSLFQLFLAVHERGGYAQVTDHRRWSAVYREVTETPCNTDVHNSRAAKIFYYRYLYPYELYIHGKDFREFVPHIEGGKDEAAKKRRRKSTKKRQKMTRHSPNQQHGLKGAWTTVENQTEVMEEDIASDSLMEMIQVLEENSRLEFEDVQLEDEIDITFYNDSTPSKDQLLSLMAYEPQASPVHVVPSMTEPGNGTDKKEGERAASSGHVLQKLENAHEVEEDGKNSACPQPAEHEQQMVPRVPTPDSNIDDGAGSGSGSAFSQQMLHQLDALQEGIDFIDDYME